MRWVSILSAGLGSLVANNVSECACASVSNAIQYEYQQRKVETMTTKLQPKTLREMWVRDCRMTGQGLIQGKRYLIREIEYEAFGDDMMLSSGVVVDMRGNVFEVNNLHIAFDLEDVFDPDRAV